MKSEAKNQSYNYSELYSEYFFRRQNGPIKNCPEHTLIFVFAGELLVQDGNIETTIRKGQYIFLRKDSNIILLRNSLNEESFSGVFLGFNRSFLCEFYRLMNKTCLPYNDERFSNNIIELPCNPYMDSMYISLRPYFDWNIQPVKAVLEIKLMEAVFSLLQTDPRFYNSLFGFLKPWETNVSAEIPSDSIKRYHCHKGNTVSTMQEDIKWLYMFGQPRLFITQKMEADYIKKKNAGKTAEIYFEVNYRDNAQLIEALRNHYGKLPPN